MKNAQVVLSATVVQNPEGAGLGRDPWNRQRGRDTAGRSGRWTGERSGIRQAGVVVGQAQGRDYGRLE